MRMEKENMKTRMGEGWFDQSQRGKKDEVL